MTEGPGSLSIYPDQPPPRGLVTAAWRGKRWRPDGTDVFCGDRSNQPPILFETRHFYAVPDLFPISPGHILIIPKEHYPAYGAMPKKLERELEQVIDRARSFIRESYPAEPMVWENGGPGSGQSVHHAHMHLIPLPRTVTAIPPPQLAIPLSRGLDEVRAWWRSAPGGRPYHIMEYGADRRLLPAASPDLQTMNLFKAQHLNIPTTPDGRRWVRERNPVEVARTLMLYQRWAVTHPQRGMTSPDSGLAA